MKPRKLAFDQQLSTIPLRNEGVKLSVDPDGTSLAVQIELRYRGVLALWKRVFKLRPNRTYLLDGIGRSVFESIDGKKNFEQLVDEFAAKHQLTFFEARALLMQYIKLLMNRGLIVIGVPERAK